MTDDNQVLDDEEVETQEPSDSQEDEQTENENPETESENESESDGELEEGDEPSEAHQKKKKGKSRNQRLYAKLGRLEDQNAALQAQLATLTSAMNPSQTNQTMTPHANAQYGQSNQVMQANGQQATQQSPLTPEQALHQVKMQRFGQELNDLRENNDDVDEILNNPNHPFGQLSTQTVQSLPYANLSPKRLFEINKAFPKELRRLRGLSSPDQLFLLTRLDGKLDALKSERQANLKNMPEPTGVLKGGSAKITGKLSPKEQLQKLRNSSRG